MNNNNKCAHVLNDLFKEINKFSIKEHLEDPTKITANYYLKIQHEGTNDANYVNCSDGNALKFFEVFQHCDKWYSNTYYNDMDKLIIKSRERKLIQHFYYPYPLDNNTYEYTLLKKDSQ
jgi:hypothetical protein